MATLTETGIVAAGVALLAVVHLAREASTPPVAAVQRVSFAPSPITTSTGGLLDPAPLADNESCRECHPDSYAQWESSIHAKAAYNADPYHRKTFEYMLRTSEPNLIRFCSGCHDPVLLVSGQMQELTRPVDFSRNPYANASITCNSCHAMTAIDIRGNGGFTLSPPQVYPFAGSTSPIGKFLNALLIKVKPEPHRKAYLKPFHKTSEFCAVCHKLAVPQSVNGYKWMRGQNQYDVWHNSGMSDNSAVSWYSAPKPFAACQECHMKRVGSTEYGAEGHSIPNHWTPAANSAMAILAGDTAWLARTVRFLQDKRVSVDLFGVVVPVDRAGARRRNPAPVPDRAESELLAPLGSAGIRIAAGSEVRLEAVIRTRLVGHRFPECTVDINEVRLEVRGIDAGGREFFHSGAVDAATLEADSSAHFVRNRLFTEGDTLITRHNINNWTGTLYNNAIPPGSAQTVHYAVRIPTDAHGTVHFIAELHYRKFNNAYTQFALAGFDTSHMIARLPYDIRMAADTATIDVGATASRPSAIRSAPRARERFNDYGIGLFVQGDMRGASAAFRRVTEIDSAYADGFINLARIAMSEGNLPAMADAIARAERAQPDFYKAHYFRGVYAKMTGSYEEALREFRSVNTRFPLDRATLAQIGRVLYLRGEFAASREWYGKLLAIDPEDFTAHYNAALCERALGHPDSAAAHEAGYASYKEDERIREFALPYRLAHPSENNEAEPIHVHGGGLAEPARAAARRRHPSLRTTTLNHAVTLR